MKEFWITNVSKQNVCLEDLGIYVKPFSSINLLSKHYDFTLNDIKQSCLNGALFKKKKKISIRKVAPNGDLIIDIFKISEATSPTKQRSLLEIHHEKYDELELSDDEFAAQNTELEMV